MMRRIDLSYFYRLGLSFRELRDIPEDAEVVQFWFLLYETQNTIRMIYNDSLMKSAHRTSQGSATNLYKFLEDILGRDIDTTFSKSDKAKLLSLLNAYEPVLQSELAIADAYYVLDKAPFSTITLVTDGSSMFSSDLKAKVPAALHDLNEAGKCLAFELATACGFHTMRAMEIVLRRYWEVVSGGKPHPEQRNIGVYLREMDQNNYGSVKIRASIRQLKDLHRNEISHPGTDLSVEEAISLIGITRSAVDAMLKEIPDEEFTLIAEEPPQPRISAETDTI